MISPCVCTNEAKPAVCELFGIGEMNFDALEIEFRELPYFLVARSNERWIPGERTEAIELIRIIDATERGLIVDPRDRPSEVFRRVLIPWQNVISFSMSGASPAAGGR